MFSFISAENLNRSVIGRDFHIIFEVIFFFNLTLVTDGHLVGENSDFDSSRGLEFLWHQIKIRSFLLTKNPIAESRLLLALTWLSCPLISSFELAS